MSDKKISQLTAGGNAQATDELPIARAGTNVKVTGADIAAAATKLGTLTSLTVSGVTTLSAGTAAAPALTTSGDTNNGIYFPAADVTAITTAGTERLRVDASGNLGIGTASPSSYGFLAALSGATAKTAWFDTTAATAYSAGSNFANAIVTLRTGANATGNATGIRFASSANGSLEGLFAYVQNASTYGDFVWQGFNGTYNERMRLDSSGNLGLGVTPSAWTSFTRVLQVATGTSSGSFAGSSADNFRMFANTFYDGAYKRIAAGYATQYEQASGSHVWYTAGTSTANSAITFTQAMTLDASGVLMVGTTTVGGGVAGDILTTSGGVKIGYVPTSTGNRGYLIPYDSSGFTQLFNSFATGGVLFVTNGAERVRITAAGNLGVGTTSPAARLDVRSGATGIQALFSQNSGEATIAIGATTTTYNLRAGYSIASEYGYLQATAASGVADDIIINPNGGNLGIGTTTPGQALEVAGRQRFSGSSVGIAIENRMTDVSVTTSAVTILDAAGAYGRLVVVNGGSGADRFCDLVLASTTVSPTVVSSYTASGSPAARTYTRSGSALQLAMASGTYSVWTLALGY